MLRALPLPSDEASDRHAVLGSVAVGRLPLHGAEIDLDLEAAVASRHRSQPPVARPAVREPKARVGRGGEPAAEEREAVAYLCVEAPPCVERAVVRGQRSRIRSGAQRRSEALVVAPSIGLSQNERLRPRSPASRRAVALAPYSG